MSSTASETKNRPARPQLSDHDKSQSKAAPGNGERTSNVDGEPRTQRPSPPQLLVQGNHNSSTLFQDSEVTNVNNYNYFIGGSGPLPPTYVDSSLPNPSNQDPPNAKGTPEFTTMHSLKTNIMKGLHDTKQIESLEAFFATQTEFLNYLAQSGLLKRSGSLQARANNLVTLAGVSILLGVVQFASISFMAGPSVSATEQNYTAIWKAIDFFSFCGISFDVLGALFALWTYRSLLLTISRIEGIMLKKQTLLANVFSTLNSFLDAPHPPAGESTQSAEEPRTLALRQETLPETLVDLFTNFRQSCASHHRQARGLVHLIDDHLPVQEDVIALAIIAAGLLLFFVSLFSFIISTRPLSVWASTTVVVAVTFMILRINLGHQQPGYWRFIARKIRATVTETFPLRKVGRGSEAVESA